jgi:shikimate dehydrogenase
MQIGLLGFPLGHSFSKPYFEQKFAANGDTVSQYTEFAYANIDDFWREIVRPNPDLVGFNVTIPHKKNIIKYVDSLDAAAKAVGAVNTVKRLPTGEWRGYNTDILGFEQSLAPLLQGAKPAALVLGTGGAAQAVQYVFRKMDIAFTQVSRMETVSKMLQNPFNFAAAFNKTITYEALAEQNLCKYPLIINATPIGMSPNDFHAPQLNYAQLTPQHIIYDLIYNPAETRLLALAKAQGCTCKNGLEMLHLQADAAWEIWRA